MRCFYWLTSLVLLELCVGISSWIECELYKSEELTRWSAISNKLIDLLDKTIRIEEDKLRNLYNIQRLLLKFNGQDAQTRDGNASRVVAEVGRMEHPVEAFVSLNCFLKATSALQSILGDNEFDRINEKFNFPSIDDLIGCGEALLRLQKFYALDLDDIVEGRIGQFSSTDSFMERNDCFQIGRIAYEAGDYMVATRWLQKAVKLNDDNFTDISELLEYLAFASYKNNQIRYAAEITKLWLEKDPDNERALSNLMYYEEELEQYNNTRTMKLLGDDGTLSVPDSSIRATQTKSYVDKYSLDKVFTIADYDFSEDDIVKDLCTSNSNEIVSQNICIKKISLSDYLISPELKIEVLSTDPSLFRIYDIISEEEANYIRHIASFRLHQSTVQTREGLVTSDYRIAKTAWLSGRSNQIVDRIERRLGQILNIDLNGSEDLQIVRYGIGGYYGPHLDSARETLLAISKGLGSTSEGALDSSKKNDRLATILIYLNDVKSGGATVFPKLNLSVKPIKRSAVIWYNLLKNGYTDERTLHTGCPVLLGSKWIATKWPHEDSNIFSRPCGLLSEK